jgi:hypothetical protein
MASVEETINTMACMLNVGTPSPWRRRHWRYGAPILLLGDAAVIRDNIGGFNGGFKE